MIEWVFWDMGDTLLSEDRLRCALYERLHAVARATSPELSFRDLVALRSEQISSGNENPQRTIARSLLDDDAYKAWAGENLRFVTEEGQNMIAPVDGAAEALRRLSEGVRLGVIAAQPESALATLDRCGLTRWFDVVALDSVTGKQKRTGELFEWALARAGVSPERAAMVGNRLEADVAPARRLGMRTVFCYLSPEEKGWHPTEPDRRYYLDELARVPNWRREPLAPEEAPDATVRSMAEVDPLIAAWQRES